jgi:hypothetical protein
VEWLFDDDYYDVLPVHRMLARATEEDGRLMIPDNAVVGVEDNHFYLKNEKHRPEYKLVAMAEEAIFEGYKAFKTQAIVGHVDVVDGCATVNLSGQMPTAINAACQSRIV